MDDLTNCEIVKRCIDNLSERENLCHLLDRIVEIRLTIIDQYARADMDGAITWDDMGTNERVFVSPQLFRAIYLVETCEAQYRAFHRYGIYPLTPVGSCV